MYPAPLSPKCRRCCWSRLRCTVPQCHPTHSPHVNIARHFLSAQLRRRCCWSRLRCTVPQRHPTHFNLVRHFLSAQLRRRCCWSRLQCPAAPTCRSTSGCAGARFHPWLQGNLLGRGIAGQSTLIYFYISEHKEAHSSCWSVRTLPNRAAWCTRWWAASTASTAP